MKRELGKNILAFKVWIYRKSGPPLIFIVIADDEDQAIAYARSQAVFEGFEPEEDGHKAVEMFRSPVTLGVLARLS